MSGLLSFASLRHSFQGWLDLVSSNLASYFGVDIGVVMCREQIDF